MKLSFSVHMSIRNMLKLENYGNNYFVLIIIIYSLKIIIKL